MVGVQKKEKVLLNFIICVKNGLKRTKSGFWRYTLNTLFISCRTKYLLLVFYVVCGFGGFAQITTESVINYTNTVTAIPHRLTKNPVTLAHALTKDKVSEREKFDAIYAWVATRIHYDYSSYFSSNGYGPPDIKQILKYRYAICLGYANLMDTLCQLSGIENVTVYGYAKDHVFDVNDSIYIDNHAWNAVKLDGKWFVYDVTWSSGRPQLKLGKWSNFKYKLYQKLYKKVKIKKKIYKTVVRSYCDTVVRLRIDTFTYRKRGFFNALMLVRLAKSRYYYKRTFTHELNTDYYLSEPDKFAITHFPDDDAWSLTAMHKIREFECDSSFYHLNDSSYKYQNRHGKTCIDCDAWLSYNALNKEYRLRNASAANNPRNKFITTLCNYNISKLKLYDSKSIEDSLGKVTILDTALAYSDLSIKNLREAFLNIDVEHELQRNKNRHKENLLLDENFVHREFINKHKHLIRTQNYSVMRIERSFKMNFNKSKRQLTRSKRLDGKEEVTENVKNTEAKIAELNRNLRFADSLLSIINLQIVNLKQNFEATQKILNTNVLFKISQNDSVFGPFRKSTEMRVDLKDNYKKEVVDVRKDINRNKLNYIKDLEEKIFTPVNTWEQQAAGLFDAIEKRNKLEELIYKLKAELVRRGKLPNSELLADKKKIIADEKEDLCWIQSNKLSFKRTFFLFDIFMEKQKDAYFTIERENRVEGSRYVFIERELQRRKRKYRNTMVTNFRVLTLQNRAVKKEKREFLKKLRKERREAAKKSK